METFFRLGIEQSGFLIGVIFGYGPFLYSLGLIHSQIKKIAVHQLPYKAIGSLITLLITFILTFSFSQEAGGEIAKLATTYNFYTGFFFLPVVAITLSICALYYGKIDSQTLKYEVLGLLPIFAAFALFVMLPIKGSLYPFVFNVLILYEITGLLFIGYYNREGILINLGLIFFVIEIFARYFDFFWRFLPKSLFFIVGGLILLLGGARLEKKRREIMEHIHSEKR